ncbi:MAG: hypothetical protein WDZ84_08130 [Rhodovibrionaceae bacterium]
MSIFTAIITIGASGVLATIVAFRLNATKEHVIFMRQKIESLYMNVEKYERSMNGYFVSYYILFKNEISYNELYDIQKNSFEDGKGPGEALEKSKMLVSVYFPSLKPNFHKYLEHRKKLNSIIVKHKRAYECGETDGTPWLEPFDRAFTSMDLAAEALKQGILEEAIHLASTDNFLPSLKELKKSLGTLNHLFQRNRD